MLVEEVDEFGSLVLLLECFTYPRRLLQVDVLEVLVVAELCIALDGLALQNLLEIRNLLCETAGKCVGIERSSKAWGIVVFWQFDAFECLDDGP